MYNYIKIIISGLYTSTLVAMLPQNEALDALKFKIFTFHGQFLILNPGKATQKTVQHRASEKIIFSANTSYFNQDNNLIHYLVTTKKTAKINEYSFIYRPTKIHKFNSQIKYLYDLDQEKAIMIANDCNIVLDWSKSTLDRSTFFCSCYNPVAIALKHKNDANQFVYALVHNKRICIQESGTQSVFNSKKPIIKISWLSNNNLLALDADGSVYVIGYICGRPNPTKECRTGQEAIFFCAQHYFPKPIRQIAVDSEHRRFAYLLMGGNLIRAVFGFGFKNRITQKIINSYHTVFKNIYDITGKDTLHLYAHNGIIRLIKETTTGYVLTTIKDNDALDIAIFPIQQSINTIQKCSEEEREIFINKTIEAQQKKPQ